METVQQEMQFIEGMNNMVTEVLGIPSDTDEFKFKLALRLPVKAMVQNKVTQAWEAGESNEVFIHRRELREAIPVKFRPLITNDMLALILPYLQVTLEPKEIKFGDPMPNGKPAAHDTIIHNVVAIETAKAKDVIEAYKLLK